jgi:aminomethyltransferase
MNLKETPLIQAHKNLKGKMVEFGGWNMPVQYSGLVEEHKAVRSKAGLFDVSHMGELLVSGKDAESLLQKATTNNVSILQVGQAQYSALCSENGTPIDDILVYKMSKESFFLCVNASNIEKDFEWLKSIQGAHKLTIQNQSEFYAQIAIQGPLSRQILSKAVDTSIEKLPYYCFLEGKVFGTPGVISRTGYTGELGYELYVPAHKAHEIWNGLMEIGQALGMLPCGLGCRDTLRLEAGYLLYGNDMWNETSMLECGLGWITKFDKGDFFGKQALINQKNAGLSQKLIAFEMEDKGVARHGFSVLSANGQKIGIVTSASPSPSLQKNIGFAYVPAQTAVLGKEIYIDIRGSQKLAKIVKKPFYTLGTVQN